MILVSLRTGWHDKRDRAISFQFSRDPHLSLEFSGLLQKDLFKER